MKEKRWVVMSTILVLFAALGLDISQHDEHYGFADHAEAELEEVSK